MNNIEYLISRLPDGEDKCLKKLREILTSSSVEENEGNPRTLRVGFIRSLYTRRREALSSAKVETFGVDELIDKISILPGDAEVLSYSLKNALYSGECFMVDNIFIGCAFVRKGLSFSIQCLTSDD